MKKIIIILVTVWICAVTLSGSAFATDNSSDEMYRTVYLEDIVDQVPKIIKFYDGTGLEEELNENNKKVYREGILNEVNSAEDLLSFVINHFPDTVFGYTNDCVQLTFTGISEFSDSFMCFKVDIKDENWLYEAYSDWNVGDDIYMVVSGGLKGNTSGDRFFNFNYYLCNYTLPDNEMGNNELADTTEIIQNNDLGIVTSDIQADGSIKLTTKDFSFVLPSTWKDMFTLVPYYIPYGEMYGECDYDAGCGYKINFYENNDFDGEYGGYLGELIVCTPETTLRWYNSSPDYFYYSEGSVYLGTMEADNKIYHLQLDTEMYQDCADENCDMFFRMIDELEQSICQTLSPNEGVTITRKNSLREDAEFVADSFMKYWLPESWGDNYSIDHSWVSPDDSYGEMVSFYEEPDHENGMSGLLFQIGFFEKDPLGAFGESIYMGMLKKMGEDYEQNLYVMLFYPFRDDLYTEENKEIYLKMQKDIPLIPSMWELNDDCRWMYEYEIEYMFQNIDDGIPKANAYSRILGTVFNKSGVTAGALPALYKIEPASDVWYVWVDNPYGSGQEYLGVDSSGNIVVSADWVESPNIVRVRNRLSSDVVWPDPKVVKTSTLDYLVWKLENGYLILGTYGTNGYYMDDEVVTEVFVSRKELCEVLNMD